MTLRDVVEGYDNIETIMCRFYVVTTDGQKWDELFGYCALKEGELISLDGDDYSLDDLILESEWCKDEDEKYLVVWLDTVPIV